MARVTLAPPTAGLQNTTAQAHKHVATPQNQIPVPKQKQYDFEAFLNTFFDMKMHATKV